MDYFSQEQPRENVEDNQSDVSLVRSSNSGDKIYLIKNRVKHWVTSPQVLKALGYDFGQEKEVDKSEMANYISGVSIKMENVNEFILPVEEAKEEVVEEIKEETVEIPAQAVDNAPIEGYISIIIPCILSVNSLDGLLVYVENLKKYFSGEIITVVVNQIAYKDYSPKFGHKVIECENLAEGVMQARRVARGVCIETDEIM